MSTNHFKVSYASGVQTDYHSTCATVEAFCNEHFGSTWPEASANGATVEMVVGDAAEPEIEREPVVHEASGSVEGAGASSEGV
jgi:hypothetical protein